jgi:hypothetical protein
MEVRGPVDQRRYEYFREHYGEIAGDKDNSINSLLGGAAVTISFPRFGDDLFAVMLEGVPANDSTRRVLGVDSENSVDVRGLVFDYLDLCDGEDFFYLAHGLRQALDVGGRFSGEILGQGNFVDRIMKRGGCSRNREEIGEELQAGSGRLLLISAHGGERPWKLGGKRGTRVLAEEVLDSLDMERYDAVVLEACNDRRVSLDSKPGRPPVYYVKGETMRGKPGMPCVSRCEESEQEKRGLGQRVANRLGLGS